jgi:N-methylhydantoinase B/oxoprolinase/acetone carboxylase alpha subunit
VFHSRRVIAMRATMIHHGDSGGYSPGSLPPNSAEIYQEGLRIPALRFREAGAYYETLVEILRLNSRRGVIHEYEVLADAVSFTHRGECHFSAAPGLAGGRPSAPARSAIRRAEGSEQVIPSKALTVLNKGDRVIVETPGGGGDGEASKRSGVAQDIANGKVSADAPRAQ